MKNFELTFAAEQDLKDIWLYTYETWGFDQAEKYYDQIISCCEAIGNGMAHSKTVEGLDYDIHVYKCERHYIFFLPHESLIILAILHERMDFLQRLTKSLSHQP